MAVARSVLFGGRMLLAHNELLYPTVKNFRAWEAGDRPWPAQFMLDSELNWLEGRAPVEDL